MISSKYLTIMLQNQKKDTIRSYFPTLPFTHMYLDVIGGSCNKKCKTSVLFDNLFKKQQWCYFFA